ncbi:MAG: PilZ domain-containing protein [Alphaproteobacteria bacterium]|nr:PilZ domain-containing protein [Alphaproteobacteria bacterium]
MQKSRRKVVRRKVLWGARLASLNGERYLHCMATDISCAGARVKIENQHFIASHAYFIDLSNRFAYEARVVWQRPPEMGLEFIRGYRFDEVPSEPLRRAIESEY